MGVLLLKVNNKNLLWHNNAKFSPATELVFYYFIQILGPVLIGH